MNKKRNPRKRCPAVKPNAQKMMVWSTIRWVLSILQIPPVPMIRKRRTPAREEEQHKQARRLTPVLCYHAIK